LILSFKVNFYVQVFLKIMEIENVTRYNNKKWINNSKDEDKLV
jgi:hypothetical protein